MMKTFRTRNSDMQHARHYAIEYPIKVGKEKAFRRHECKKKQRKNWHCLPSYTKVQVNIRPLISRY